MKLVDGMLLYHGSYVPVEKIDLTKCDAGKDFGQGFYLTTDKIQAQNFIRTSLLKAKVRKVIPENQNYGYVTCYKYHAPSEINSIYEFPDANMQWLWFIALNRRNKLATVLKDKIDSAICDSDVIIGKIANDTTNPVITTYLNGLYGEIDKESSAQIAISLLLPNRLKEQYCFLTQQAIDCLETVEVERYEL